MVIITKKSFCPACMMTKKVMNARGIKYTERHLEAKNATEMMKLRNHLRDIGISSFPIVMPDGKLDDKSFCGFRPEKLNA